MKESEPFIELVSSTAELRPRAGPIFLSFVQPAIDRAFAGVPVVLAPGAERAARGALKKAAAASDVSAQLRLGFLYDEGLGVPQDRVRARGWYKMAAEQGHARAALCLGRIYYFGQGVDPDYSEAAHWYRRAAEGGEVSAQANLGYMHAHGLGVACDYGQAFRCLLHASEQGDSKAQSNLALIYFHRHDYAESIRWHRAAAEQGNGPSMCNLGQIYSMGVGVPRDIVEATKWFALGALYRKEQANDSLSALIPSVSASDWAKILRWCRCSAEAGKPRAQLLLGALYYEGLGVPKNIKTAVKWLRSSAKKGNTKSQWRLGYMYYCAIGVPRDFDAAFRMYWQAAWKNDTHSQIMIGECYWYGHGVRRNLREAAKWYRRVAERGSPAAQSKLAKMHESGQGVRRDPKEAALWALLASAQDAAGALEQWTRLSRKLTPAEACRIRWQAVMRWPALAWKIPVPSLRHLLRGANESLPEGRPAMEEAALTRFWSPSVWGDALPSELPRLPP